MEPLSSYEKGWKAQETFTTVWTSQKAFRYLLLDGGYLGGRSTWFSPLYYNRDYKLHAVSIIVHLCALLFILNNKLFVLVLIFSDLREGKQVSWGCTVLDLGGRPRSSHLTQSPYSEPVWFYMFPIHISSGILNILLWSEMGSESHLGSFLKSFVYFIGTQHAIDLLRNILLVKWPRKAQGKPERKR